MSSDLVTLHFNTESISWTEELYSTFLSVTSSFLYANLGFPQNSYEFYGADYFALPTGGDDVTFLVHVVLPDGADTVPGLSQFFVSALASEEYRATIVEELLDSNVVVPEIQVLDPPPYEWGFGRV